MHITRMMQRPAVNILQIAPRALILACTALVCGCATHGGRFEIGLIGDAPYTAVEEAKFPRLIQAMNGSELAFVVHVGDLQADPRGYRNGSQPCTDQTLANRKNLLEASRHPLILTPGDNDWTDCNFTKPAIDPVVRLEAVRDTFFSGDRTLGQRSIAVVRQSSDPSYGKFRENLRWVHGGIMFVTLHMVGSNNNLGRTPEADAEYIERNAANLAWMKRAFELAKRDQLKAVMILTQANPYFEDRWPAFYTRLLRVAPPAQQPSGFREFLAALESEVVAYGRPVALVHGDTHYFRIDKPLFALDGGRMIENLTRVETFGSPYVHWVRVVVDPADPRVFTFTPEMVSDR